MPHAAMEASMLQRMNDEEARRFTPSVVLLYWHAQEAGVGRTTEMFDYVLYNGKICTV